MSAKKPEPINSKNKHVDLAVKELQEKYGEGSIMRLGDVTRVDVDVIPTGSISLDLALGVGGIPRGRIREIEGEMDQQHMGLQARLMSHALRKLTAIVAKSNTTVIFINQLRMKIGVMFGNPETTTGGMALKFYSSVRIDIRRSAQIQAGEKIIGNRTKVKIVKNKVAPPFRTCEFDILYNEGISRHADVIHAGVRYSVVNKAGSWFAYNGEKIGQGIEGARQYLKENQKIEKEIAHKVRKAAAHEELGTSSVSVTDEQSEEEKAE